MQVSILVVLYRGKEKITIHGDESAAWSELLRFVRARTPNDRGNCEKFPHLTDDEAVEQFFSANEDVYFLGIANLSELSELFDVSMR